MNSARWRSPACRKLQFTHDGFHGQLRIGAAATLRPSSGHRRAVRAILSRASGDFVRCWDDGRLILWQACRLDRRRYSSSGAILSAH